MSTPTVMVVEDDEALRESVCELLQEVGFEAICFENGRVALDRLRSAAKKPARILLDLMMPGYNGWQFRDEQLKDPALSGIPVVVMTASRDVRDISADEVVYKPLTLNRLLEVVRRHSAGNQPSSSSTNGTEVGVARARPRDIGGLEAGLRTGGGEMGALVRATDWSETPLGPIERWPIRLQLAVSLCLASRYQVIISWGRELIQIYNDAFIAIAGGKHPKALGQGAKECWPEMWPTVAPMYEHVFATRTATRSDNIHLPVERHGYLEESFYTMSFTPVFLETGEVGGVFNVILETTEAVVAERRTRTMRDLAARTADARSAAEACSFSAQALKGNADIRFALVYLFDQTGQTLRLVEAVGVACGGPASPLAVGPSQHPWPCAETLERNQATVVREIERRFGVLARGPWGAPVGTAVVLPLPRLGQARPWGVLVLGLTPQRELDDHFHSFLEQVSAHVATAIGNARAYEEERARSEQLAALDRAKTAFFSNVSHEFRTPLTLMLGPTEDLLAGTHGELATGIREQLALVHRSELRLQRLVNALLDFSRIEAGRSQAAYEPVDLATLTRDLASAFRSGVERAGLELHVDCEPSSEPVFVDRDMWEKIVLNLLSNAFKFTTEGRIEVSLRPEGERAVLRVRDTGVGIAEENLPRVFERFHRIEGAKARTQEGSGIGLALVQELVKLHGGSVHVDSRVGVGSTFTVAIPVGSAHLPAERLGRRNDGGSTALGAAPFVEEALHWLPDVVAASASATAQSLATSFAPTTASGPRSARVLLADDNADMRDYVRRLLEPHWTVEAVEDGQRALETARAQPPDLILSDVMMPRLDGFELLRALRADERTKTIPLVLLSARAGEEALIQGLSAGADDYVVKPFSARELVARVRAQLELVRLRKEVHAKQEQLFSVLMQAPAVICVIRGPELVYEMANDLYRRVVGGRDVVGKSLLEAVPELEDQGFDDLLRDVMRTGEAYEGHERPARLDRTGNGQIEDTYWNFVYAPLQGFDGQPRVIAVAHDVTEQVLARRQTHQSEARFRALVEQVEAGIAEVDLAGRFTFVNDRFRDLVGRSTQELLQSRVQDVTHADDLAATLNGLQRVVERGSPFFIEKRYVRPDGSIVWVQKSYARVEDDQGRPRGVALAAIDTTQRKFAERALRESEERANQLAARIARLQEATERLASALSSSEVAEVFLGISETIVGSAATVVYFSDPFTGELELTGSRGLSEDALQKLRVLRLDAPLPLATAIAAREPIWIETHAQLLSSYPGLSSAQTPGSKLQAMAAIPLVQGERVLGGIAMSFEQARRFDDEERHWLTSLAAQCVVAAERVRLYRGEQSARLEAETLLRVAESLGTSQTDLDRLVQRVTDEATALIGASFGALFYNVTNPDGESYVLYTLSGAPREAFAKLGLPRNTPLFGTTFRGEGIVRLDDVTQDRRYGKVSPHYGMPEGHLPVTSYLAAPVVARSGAVLGGLFFGHPLPARFTEAHERLVSAIATNAGVAIENAQLLKASREAEELQARRARQATFASEVGAAFARGGPLRAILEASCALAVQHLDVALARIWTSNVETSTLEPRASAGMCSDIDDAHGGAPTGRPLVSFVAQERRAHLTNDVVNDPRVRDPEWLRRERLVAFAGYPLIVEDKLVGVFAMFARRKLSEDMFEALESVARTIAIGIERTRADEHRTLLLEDLQRTIQFSETFVGILGHDLRNPLGAITAATDLLLLRETNERVARPIERIRTSAGRMARMIEQILDFTRARIGGGIPIKPARVELLPLATELVEELEGAAPQQILLDARGSLGGDWDGDRLAQVISNLLGNAIEHGDAGSPVRLDLDGTAQDVVRLSVKNSGAIAASDIPALFVPFRRAASESKARKSKGLGLGLYIVQQIVHAHAGRIEARSSDVEGTVFIVELPRVASGASSTRLQPEASS
jgi:PAS domain S-box-containing protein